MSRVSTRPGGSSLSLSLRIDRRRRRRDIPRKIVRVLCESQLLAEETLRRAISLSFHLNRGRGTIVCVRVFASHIFSFISVIRWDGFLTSQPRRFRIAYCFIRSRISSPVAISRAASSPSQPPLSQNPLNAI